MTDTPNQLTQIERALIENDFDTVRTLAHGLNRAVQTSGDEIIQIVQKLEDTGRLHAEKGADELFRRIKAEFGLAAKQLDGERTANEHKSE